MYDERTNFHFSAEIELQDVDGISCIKINPWNSILLAASTWNGFVDIYNIKTRNRSERTNLKCPQLAVEWISSNNYASGGADGIVYINGVQIGFHDSPISSLAFSVNNQILASGSYDGVVKFWNSRSNECVFKLTTDDKIYCMASAPPNNIVCGCLESRIISLNCKTFGDEIIKTMTHGYNTRQITACESAIATSVVQGRIAVVSLNDLSNKYAFKAHLSEPKGESNPQMSDISLKCVYPVNALCFQPGTDYLASGGSDGYVHIWNVKIKRKLQTLMDEENGAPFNTSISSISFSNNGDTLAVAVSYCFENGPISHAPDRLIIYTDK